MRSLRFYNSSMRKQLIFWILMFIGTAYFQSCQKVPSDNSSDIITPETAMKAYLNNGDTTFSWELKNQMKGSGITFYQIQFTSQTWHTIRWTHEIIIMIPDNLVYNNALLVINGGGNTDEIPDSHSLTDGTIQYVGTLAVSNKAIIALLYQVPNQPIWGLSEDALISETLSNYLKDGDFSWPLLFPMTKSAIKAMDVIQQFSQVQVSRNITGFVIAGASKRGWTTWLAGANDKRAVAIAPMVIDMLNMSVNIEYQKIVWGDYSTEIQDYVNLGLAQQFGTPAGTELVTMIDPYSYRNSLNMPKMIFMGTNDPYWPVDAVKNYIDDIPGDNRLCYTPNAGHDLGNMTKALSSLNAFFSILNTNSIYPKCDYQIEEKDGKIILTVNTTPDLLGDAYLWSATSVNDQDFRNETWNSVSLNTLNHPQVQVVIDYPVNGYKAFFVDLKYIAPSNEYYTQSTRVFVADETKLLLKN
jgi:PhoPQ-activated pathogenicity-related protein